MEQMHKKALIIGMSALAITGLAIGCTCMPKQKKPKLNIDSLSNMYD